MPVEKICKGCGKEFMASKHPGQMYCSKKCVERSRQTGKTLLERTCPHCGKKYTFEKGRSNPQYCGMKCAGAAKRMDRKNLTCEHCGKVFHVKPWKESIARFCSRECTTNGLIGEKNPLWKGGHSGDRGPNWDRQRREARKRDGYRCQCCGIKQKKKKAHAVHHIVPFREFGYIRGINHNYVQANELSNLITLCASCHNKAESGLVPLQIPLINW